VQEWNDVAIQGCLGRQSRRAAVLPVRGQVGPRKASLRSALARHCSTVDGTRPIKIGAANRYLTIYYRNFSDGAQIAV
jgi:hypothetical protein